MTVFFDVTENGVTVSNPDPESFEQQALLLFDRFYAEAADRARQDGIDPSLPVRIQDLADRGFGFARVRLEGAEVNEVTVFKAAGGVMLESRGLGDVLTDTGEYIVDGFVSVERMLAEAQIIDELIDAEQKRTTGTSSFAAWTAVLNTHKMFDY